MAKKRAGLDAMREKFGEALKGLTSALKDSTDTAKNVRGILSDAKDDIESALDENELTIGGPAEDLNRSTDHDDPPPAKSGGSKKKKR